MENFIGPDVFYGAISTYLNKYVYANAETADLFNVLQDAVGDKLNVSATMDTWLRQEGYPVINVTRAGDKFVLNQKRFLADVDTEYNASKSDYGWASEYVGSKHQPEMYVCVCVCNGMCHVIYILQI